MSDKKLREALQGLYDCFDDEGELREEYQDQLSTALETAYALLSQVQAKGA